jgi:hypothetical protein
MILRYRRMTANREQLTRDINKRGSRTTVILQRNRIPGSESRVVLRAGGGVAEARHFHGLALQPPRFAFEYDRQGRSCHASLPLSGLTHRMDEIGDNGQGVLVIDVLDGEGGYCTCARWSRGSSFDSGPVPGPPPRFAWGRCITNPNGRIFFPNPNPPALNNPPINNLDHRSSLQSL